MLNDVRFHKEQLGKETGTYVHHRAHFEGKTTLQILSELKSKAILAGENTLDILTRFGNEATVKAWQRWEYGYACVIIPSLWTDCMNSNLVPYDRLWHLEGDRYKLKDLNLIPRVAC